MQRIQGTTWVFTINMEDLDRDGFMLDASTIVQGWDDAGFAAGKLVRAAWQLEMGQNGVVHWQGVLVTKRMDLSALSKVSWLRRAHLERAKGTARQCFDYATKEDTRLEGPFFYPQREAWGREIQLQQAPPRPGQGRRTDLDDFIARIRAGATDRELADEFPFHYGTKSQMIARLRALLERPQFHAEPPEVIVILGPAGTGKTYYANTTWPDGYRVPAPRGDRVWFDGYVGQETLIIDEFRPCDWKYTDLLQIMNGQVNQMHTKGGFVEATHRRVVITTNINPRYWYEALLKEHNQPWEGSPLQTRITQYIVMRRTYQGPTGRKPAPEPDYDSRVGPRQPPPPPKPGGPYFLDRRVYDLDGEDVEFRPDTSIQFLDHPDEDDGVPETDYVPGTFPSESSGSHSYNLDLTE